MRPSFRVAATTMVAVALTLPAGASPATRAAPATQEGVPAFGHVFLIMGENTTYSHLKLSNAPYLLGTI